MNVYLEQALDALTRAGALGLPTAEAAESSQDGTQWSGRKIQGGDWSLRKNGEFSYSCVS